MVKLGFRPLQLHGHGADIVVSHPAGTARSAGRLPCPPAKAHALDNAGENQMAAYQLFLHHSDLPAYFFLILLNPLPKSKSFS
jgi:hypothetical protein